MDPFLYQKLVLHFVMGHFRARHLGYGMLFLGQPEKQTPLMLLKIILNPIYELKGFNLHTLLFHSPILKRIVPTLYRVFNRVNVTVGAGCMLFGHWSPPHALCPTVHFNGLGYSLVLVY